MSIEDVAQELYGLAPEDFTSARNARVKEARGHGDADLAAAVQVLRKPTTGAWLLNRLVREHGDEVAQVLELGARLRAAQGTVGADELRGLDRERRRLTHAVAQQALALGRRAGRRVSEQVADAVEETLRSAMVDATAGAALSTGLLTTTFSATGIEPLDLSGVLALGGAAGPPAAGRAGTPARSGTRVASDAGSPDEEVVPDPEHERALADARDALTAAESALQAAGDAVEAARARAADTRRERQAVEAERDEVRRRLDELDRSLASAAAAEAAGARDEDRASRDQAAALEVAERLRRQVEALLGPAGPRPG